MTARGESPVLKGHDFNSLPLRAAKGAASAAKSTGLHRLRKNPDAPGFVTGYDFSRADNRFIIKSRALAPAMPDLQMRRDLAFFRSHFSP